MKPKPKPKPVEKAKGKQPVCRYQNGQIKVTVWGNKGEYGVMYSAVLKRVYQKDDEWHETDNLDFRDMLPASLALQEAYRQVVELKGHGPKSAPNDGEDGGEDQSDDGGMTDD